MRMLKLAIALIAVLGWASAVDAGTVKKVYNLSKAYGSSGNTIIYGTTITFSAMTVTGALNAAVYTPNSTFTSHASNPPGSAWVHMQPSGKVTAKGSVMYIGWTVAGTVKMHVQGSTSCHVNSISIYNHTAMSGTIRSIPASCHLAGLWVYTKAHCTGHGFFSGARCNNNWGTPGCWTGVTDTHTQKWKTKSVHCGKINFTHTVSSAHYIRSCDAKLVPPIGHSCGSMTTQPHLASSDHGYHKIHIGGKLKSTP